MPGATAIAGMNSIVILTVVHLLKNVRTNIIPEEYDLTLDDVHPSGAMPYLSLIHCSQVRYTSELNIIFPTVHAKVIGIEGPLMHCQLE